MKKHWKKICLILIVCIGVVCVMYNTLNKVTIKANNQIIAEEQISSNVEVSKLVDKQSQPKRESTQEEKQQIGKENKQESELKPQVANTSKNEKENNQQQINQELITEQQIINISECSDELMNNYFTQTNTLNETISKQDEQTQNEIKSNMLIVTSKEENINSYGATETIKAPNNQYILVYENKEQMEQAKIELNEDEKILDVDNNNVYEFFTTQSTDNSWGVEATGLNTASNIANTKSLEEVTVAIIDTGCNIELLESYYPNKIKGTYDVYGNEEFTDEIGHGTHIAGTIAEATPDNVKIYPIKVSSSNTIYDSDIILAINYIVYNDLADVINMSFGGYHQNESMYTAIEAANNENIICVAAAGNDNTSSNCYPANYDNTISISACTQSLEKASFSNYNDSVTFTAPGTNIVSINGTSSGTSMATPHAVSAVAIYKSYNKDYTLENVIDGLKMYCTDLGEVGKDNIFGYGLINLKDITYCTCNCNSCDEIYCLGCVCETCIIPNTNKNETVSKIEVVQPAEVTTYNYGSITNLSNIVLNIQYADNTQEQAKLLELEDCEITGYNPFSYGEQTITVTYKEQTTTFVINVESEYELGWTYESNGENTVKLTGFKTTEDMENIILYIPEEIENCKVTELAEELLYEQQELIKVVTTINIKTIGENVFNNCNKLKTVQLASGITTIGNGAFYNCNLIESIELPVTVTSIGNNSFYNCTRLSNINIPTKIEEIGENAFSYTLVKTATIPEGIKTIKQGTFNNCLKLESVTLPTTLTTIESKAFYECTNISALEIPANVTSIHEDAFAKCSLLSTIIVDDENTVYDSRDYCSAIIETATNKLIVGTNYTTIPEDIVTIGANAFNGRINLGQIELPESVTTIEEYAFANCAYLEIVVVPENVTSIETNSFKNSPYVILYVYKNSYAHEYAVENGVDYRFIDATITNIYLYNYSPRVYKAFETAAMDGVIIGVVFDDNSQTYIAEGYVVEYQTGADSFRYGDTMFIIYYNQNGLAFRAGLEVVVEKATPTYTIPTDLTAKKGQKLSDVTLTDGFEWMNDTTVLSEIGTNTYPATFTPEDTDNYEIVDNIEIPVETIPAIPTEISKIDGITKTTYTAFETVNEENISLEILYDTGISETKSSGYTIKYATATDGFRYGDTKYIVQYTENNVTLTKEIAVTVNKAIPTYTTPTGLTAKRGQKLSEVVLPTGFKWMDTSITISETGNKTFKAKFTPTDTTNYEIIEDINVTITVIKEDQEIKMNSLKMKNSFLYGFKVKIVDLNNKVVSSHKVSLLAKNMTLSEDLIYEVYDIQNKKLSETSDITTGCTIKIFSSPTSSIKELIKTYYAVIYGDTNCDGIINSGDLLTIKKHLLGTKPITNDAAKEAADITQDGNINSADLLFLKKHLLGKQIISQNEY